MRNVLVMALFIVACGKVDTADSQASPTAQLVTQCASDFVRIGDSDHGYYCMTKALQTAVAWLDAGDSCSKIGATLCSFGQYYTACKIGYVESTESGWTDDLADMNNAILKAGNTCYGTSQAAITTINTKYGYRCCYTPTPRLSQ